MCVLHEALRVDHRDDPARRSVRRGLLQRVVLSVDASRLDYDIQYIPLLRSGQDDLVQNWIADCNFR